ncbi:MAG: branched-chain amino acid ABC transporter permease [Rhodospirillales bacterium]
MEYFLHLLVSGLLSGPVYALVGVAFVVLYRASSVLNFSLGAWVNLGAKLTGIGTSTLGLPLLLAIPGALAALSGLAILFNKLVVERLSNRPVTSLVMATLALGVLMRAGSAWTLTGLPSEIPVPFENALLWWGDIPFPPSRLLATTAAIAIIAGLWTFFQFSRAGIALRAIADDIAAAATVGIPSIYYLSLAWALSAAAAVAGGVLWSIDGLGGFSMTLVLAKVLPVVVIGGLTSFAGTMVAAMIIGVSENMAAGYLDPVIGTGSGALVAAVLIFVTLAIRPNGLFGTPAVQRI